MGQGQGRILSKQLARDGEKLKIEWMSGFRRQEPAEHCDVTMVVFQISDRGAGGRSFSFWTLESQHLNFKSCVK